MAKENCTSYVFKTEIFSYLNKEIVTRAYFANIAA